MEQRKGTSTKEDRAVPWTDYRRWADPTRRNEHDITQTANLLWEDNAVVYGDSGYLGVQKCLEIENNEHFSKIDFRINRRLSSLPKVSDNAIDWERYIRKVSDENGIVMPFTHVGKGQMTNPHRQTSFDEQKKKDVATYLFDIPMENGLLEYPQYDFGLTK